VGGNGRNMNKMIGITRKIKLKEKDDPYI